MSQQINGHDHQQLQVIVQMTPDGQQVNVQANFGGEQSWRLVQNILLAGLRLALREEMKQGGEAAPAQRIVVPRLVPPKRLD